MIIIEPSAEWRTKIKQLLDKDHDLPIFANAREVLDFYKGKDGRNIPLILVVANRQLPTPELDNLDDPDMAVLLEKFNRPRQVIWLIDAPIIDMPDNLRVLTKPFDADELETILKAIHEDLRPPRKFNPSDMPVLLIEPDEELQQYLVSHIPDDPFDIATPDEALVRLQRHQYPVIIMGNEAEVGWYANFQKDQLDKANLPIYLFAWEHRIRCLFLCNKEQQPPFPRQHVDLSFDIHYVILKPFSWDEVQASLRWLILDKLGEDHHRRLYRWDETW